MATSVKGRSEDGPFLPYSTSATPLSLAIGVDSRAMTRAHLRLLNSILALTLVAISANTVGLSAQPDAEVSALRDDLKARRARLSDKLGSGSMAILWSAPARVYSRDVDYEYRQDSDLLYLTGIEQPATILVLVPGSPRRSEILFITPPDPRQEHWVGKYLTREDARAHTGIETVFLTTEFDQFLASMFNRRPYGVPPGTARENTDHDGLFKALDEGTARLALRLEETPGVNQPLSDEYAFANRVRERLLGARIINLAPQLHGLRQVKTPYEQRLLAESVDISSEAHIAGMRAARPERFEREVESAIESIYLARGAMAPGYPSIVGSGPNADDPALFRLVQAHERGRSAPRRRGRQLQRTDRRHHAHLSSQRTVHAAAAGDL